jgi:hypothetical protein
MAAVDVSRVVALTNKAVTLQSKAHWAGAAEKCAEAVAAAQALQQPDCVIVAHLQALHANALLGHADTAGVPEARRVELRRSAFFELLPAAMASLQRRMAAGTLLAGACRPHEVAWCAAKFAHDDALVAKLLDLPDAVVPSARTAYVGYDAYIRTAATALEFCAVCTDVDSARTQNLPEAAAAVACSVFVANAFDMVKLCTASATVLEVTLVQNAQRYIDEQQCFRASTNNECTRICWPPGAACRAAACCSGAASYKPRASFLQTRRAQMPLRRRLRPRVACTFVRCTPAARKRYTPRTSNAAPRA